MEEQNKIIQEGLSSDDVKKRQKKNLVNYDTSVPTKSIKKILFDNFFTIFNFLNLFLGIIVFMAGSFKNMIFLSVVIINTAISTIQEIHSKKVVDRLSVLASSKAHVIRDGKRQEISINEIVIDDVLEFKTGSQIATDSIILNGTVQVNESFLTGEPDSIEKKEGDVLLSGSYIVSGNCAAKVIHVGEENYTAKISKDAKYVKKVNSEIMTSLNKIINFLTSAIIPIGIALFIVQLNVENLSLQSAVTKTVAAIIGMIPEGLVLLTSTVLAVSVVRLSKSKVLVQELYCIETLARVDTLCLDKTGTLTEGIMEVKDYIPINDSDTNMKNILSNIAKFSEDENSTINAIKDYFKNVTNEFVPVKKYAFSSKNKWSAITFENQGSYIIGAPEFILKNNFKKYENTINKYTKDYRVLVLAHTQSKIEKENLPLDTDIIGLLLITDKIRKEAKDTLEYFYKQDVNIKIISGDNPITVSKIAKQVGVKNYDKYIDMSKITDKDSILDIATNYTVFGRVTPTQKKELVLALKSKGKTVAMTGDGVNDVLALKAADCSIAMQNGSDATKNVAQLVLLDSNFASMPKVVAEGRRTINNIQRSASLFLVKTIYSTILALMFLFMGEAYPFVPIQLTLISTVTIGIPSFILALEPNNARIRGNFLRNVISKSLPTGITVALNILIISILNKCNIISNEHYSSLCVIATSICGLILLFTLTKSRKNEDTIFPFSIFRMLIALSMSALLIFGVTYLGKFFNIAYIVPILDKIAFIVIGSIIIFIILNLIFTRTLIIRKTMRIGKKLQKTVGK